MDVDDWFKGLKGSCNKCMESCANKAFLPVYTETVNDAKEQGISTDEMEIDEFALEEAQNEFTTCFYCCAGFEPKDWMTDAGAEDTCDAIFGDSVNFFSTSNDSSDDGSTLEWYW